MRKTAILGVAMTKFGVSEKTNLEMFTEIVEQLRGESGARQVGGLEWVWWIPWVVISEPCAILY